jgi:hypothetical protein
MTNTSEYVGHRILVNDNNLTIHDIINHDVFRGNIIDLLDESDVYNLNTIFNFSNDGPTNQYIDTIVDRLKSIFGSDYQKFKKSMQFSEAAISGSFIIQCILGETWVDTDIDIYVKFGGLIDCLEKKSSEQVQNYHKQKQRVYNKQLFTTGYADQMFKKVNDEIFGRDRPRKYYGSMAQNTYDDNFTASSGKITKIINTEDRVESWDVEPLVNDGRDAVDPSVDSMDTSDDNMIMNDLSYLKQKLTNRITDDIYKGHYIRGCEEFDGYKKIKVEPSYSCIETFCAHISCDANNLFTRVDGYDSDLTKKLGFEHVTINWINNYMAWDHEIQIIQLDGRVTDIFNDVIDKFDFDICKSLFSFNKYGEPVLYSPYLNNILSKTSQFGYNASFKKSITRYHKYIERGFTFEYDRDIMFDLASRYYNDMCDNNDETNHKVIEAHFIETKRIDAVLIKNNQEYALNPYPKKLSGRMDDPEHFNPYYYNAEESMNVSTYNCNDINKIFDDTYFPKDYLQKYKDADNTNHGFLSFKYLPIIISDIADNRIIMTDRYKYDCTGDCVFKLCTESHVHYKWGAGTIIIADKTIVK